MMLKSVLASSRNARQLFGSKNIQRGIITGPKKTGAKPQSSSKNSSQDEKSSGSPFDSSFTFQLFLIVGAMGAGYTLGKTTILTSPPSTLFPEGSISDVSVLKEFAKEDKERESKQYDMFKRCALRILENKGIEVDMKYGKNEALYDEKYCNEDIAKIMNVPDGMSDVFFGKDPKEWEGKKFIWYPETTNDVSLILKNCQEFKIPVYTKNSGSISEGLTFEVSFDNFKRNKFENKVEITFNMTNDELDQNSRAGDYLTKDLSAIDLFFIGCGVKLSNSNNKLVNNSFDINSIDEIECVLPDGSVTSAVNDVNDRSYGLFQMFTKFQDELCLITKLFINKHKLESQLEKQNLVVVGSNDLEQLNSILQELKTDNAISVIDNNGCGEISQRYGNYKTFAVVKLDDKNLFKLNKRFTSGEEKDDYKIERFSSSSLISQHTGGYLSDIVNESNRIVIIKENLKNPDSKTYYVSNPITTSEENDINTSLLRRVKLATDPSRVLNPGVGISVKA